MFTYSTNYNSGSLITIRPSIKAWRLRRLMLTWSKGKVNCFFIQTSHLQLLSRYSDNRLQEFFNDLNSLLKQQFPEAPTHLPRKQLNRKKHSCSICQETIPKSKNKITAETTIYRLKCRHRFHSKCLDSWQIIKKNCPMCRLSLSWYLSFNTFDINNCCFVDFHLYLSASVSSFRPTYINTI